MSIGGTPNNKEDIVVIGFLPDMPEFGQIDDIVASSKEGPAFVVQILQTQRFNHHYHGYEVTHAEYFKLVKQDQLADFHPLTLQKLLLSSNVSLLLVVMKYDIVES